MTSGVLKLKEMKIMFEFITTILLWIVEGASQHKVDLNEDRLSRSAD